MAGHEAFDPYQESSFIESLDPRYQTTAAVKEMYTFELEHVLREPFFQYELTMMPNGEFGMYNTSMSEMVDPTELGGKESLESMNRIAKVFQERSDISVATFHSRDIGFGRDYIYKFQKMENGNILATAIEYNGFEEDRQALRHIMETRAIPIRETRSQTQDLYTPLFFTEDISMRDFGQMAEQSYQTQQSQAAHSEYRLRLGVAAVREHEVFQNQQERMTQLLTTMQEKVSKYSDAQEAFEAIYQELVEYAYRPEVMHAPGLKRKDQHSTLNIDSWSDSFIDKGEGPVSVSRHQHEIEVRKFEKEAADSTNSRQEIQRTISQQQYRIAEQTFEKEVVDSTTAKPRALRHEQIAPPNSTRPVVLAEKKVSHQHMEIPIPYIPAINVVDGAIRDTGMSALGYVQQVDTLDSVPTPVQSLDLFARLRQKISTYHEREKGIEKNGIDVLTETFRYTFAAEPTERTHVEVKQGDNADATVESVTTSGEQPEQIEEMMIVVRTVLEEAHIVPSSDILMFITLEQLKEGFDPAVERMSQVLPADILKDGMVTDSEIDSESAKPEQGKDQHIRERILRIYEHVEQLDRKVAQAQETLKLIPLAIRNPNLIGGFMIHLLNVTEPILFTQKLTESDVEIHDKPAKTTDKKDVEGMKKREKVHTLNNENIVQILVRLQDIMMKYPLRTSDTFLFPESIKETPIAKSVHIAGSEKGITLQTQEGTFLLQDREENKKERALSILSRFSFSLGVFFLMSMLEEQKEGDQLLDSNEILQQTDSIGTKETEDTSWLLLSIIWYMSQIREQGIMGLIVQKPAAKKKKRKNNLPASGIIFLLVR